MIELKIVITYMKKEEQKFLKYYVQVLFSQIFNMLFFERKQTLKKKT